MKRTTKKQPRHTSFYKQSSIIVYVYDRIYTRIREVHTREIDREKAIEKTKRLYPSPMYQILS